MVRCECLGSRGRRDVENCSFIRVQAHNKEADSTFNEIRDNIKCQWSNRRILQQTNRMKACLNYQKDNNAWRSTSVAQFKAQNGLTKLVLLFSRVRPRKACHTCRFPEMLLGFFQKLSDVHRSTHDLGGTIHPDIRQYSTWGYSALMKTSKQPITKQLGNYRRTIKGYPTLWLGRPTRKRR